MSSSRANSLDPEAAGAEVGLSALGRPLRHRQPDLALLPLFVILVVTGHPLRPSLLFLPVAVAIAALFTLGVGLLLAPLAVFSDIVELAMVTLQLLMFMTLIMYPMSIVPPRWHWLVRFNPCALILEVFRDPDLLRQGAAAQPPLGRRRPRPDRLSRSASSRFRRLAGKLTFTSDSRPLVTTLPEISRRPPPRREPGAAPAILLEDVSLYYRLARSAPSFKEHAIH
ncbi:MAG: ABC transporter permease [Thermoanaerobaculia bacterium]